MSSSNTNDTTIPTSHDDTASSQKPITTTNETTAPQQSKFSGLKAPSKTVGPTIQTPTNTTTNTSLASSSLNKQSAALSSNTAGQIDDSIKIGKSHINKAPVFGTRYLVQP
jgi:hypothetical protein